MSYSIPDCYRQTKKPKKPSQPSRPQSLDLSGKPLHRTITENDAVLPLCHPLLCDAVKSYKRLKDIALEKDLNLVQQRECEMMIMTGKLKLDRLNQFYAKIFKAADKNKSDKINGICSFEDMILHLENTVNK